MRSAAEFLLPVPGFLAGAFASGFLWPSVADEATLLRWLALALVGGVAGFAEARWLGPLGRAFWLSGVSAGFAVWSSFAELRHGFMFGIAALIISIATLVAARRMFR